MNKKGHKIISVAQGSIAEELDIEMNDRLISINNKEVEDIFDYKFLISDEYIEVLIDKQDGTQWLLEIDKEVNEDLGLTFSNGLMDEYRSCSNKCIFCFIDQMPKNMRETLYFKDDDSRLSFLQGNYITLTNMKDEHIERIINYHLEPINISIHTTNPILRQQMLSNKFAGDSLKHLEKLYEANVQMNAQIVLCKGINDKEELERTISDLSKYLPYMQSLSVVPVGMTKFREGLFPLEQFTKQDAIEVIDIIEKCQIKQYQKFNIHFVHASDEWYIKAEREIPSEESYDGYLQLENGVGMMRLLIDEFNDALTLAKTHNKKKSISIATGVSAFSYINKLVDQTKEKFPGVDVNVYTITNEFFGNMITVSGLITGTDLVSQLKEKELGSTLLLPINMFRNGEDVFLDDMSIEKLEQLLNIKVKVVDTKGSDLLNAIIK